MPRRPSPTDHLDAVREKMGTIPDHEVAVLCNSTAAIVGRYRRKHGIPAYQGYKFVKGAKPPAPKSGKPRKPRKARASKLEPFRDEVGKLPDKVLAEKAGVSVEGVRMYRKRHGISLSPEARQPRGRKAKNPPAAPAAPVEASPTEASVAEAAPPRRRKRRSKLDPFRESIGTVSDRIIAEKAGVSVQAVRQYRRRHDIPAAPRGAKAAAPEAAAPVAAPVAAAPEAAASAAVQNWGFSVRIQRGDNEETAFLIASNIIEAANLATAAAADGRIIGLKQLGAALV